MSSNNPNRRWAGGVGMAVSAAFAAALIGLANAPAARADGPDPFEDLFGDTGINTWTAAADASLLSSDPTLAATLDTSVENFETLAYSSLGQDAPFSILANAFDPSAFTSVPFLFDSCVVACPTFPLDPTGDFALGLDYTVFALAPTLDPVLSDLTHFLANLPGTILELVFFPEDLLLFAF